MTLNNAGAAATMDVDLAQQAVQIMTPTVNAKLAKIFVFAKNNAYILLRAAVMQMTQQIAIQHLFTLHSRT